MATLDKIMEAMPETFLDTNTSLGTIGNVYINVGYLYSLITDDSLTEQDKKEKKDINLYDYLKSIVNGINTATGNAANLDVFIDPVDSVARIIDINYVDAENRDSVYDNAFVLEVHNLRSTVRSYNFESLSFPEQSTTTAIGAQAGGNSLGSDAITQQEFNKGLTDRIIPYKVTPPSPDEVADQAKAEASKLENLKTNLQILANYSADLDPNILEDYFGFGGDFDADNASKYANALKDIINYYKSIIQDDTKNKGILPTKLSLDMDGIGGIVVGNLFRINEDLLPNGYKGNSIGSKIAYTVTNIGHSVQNNDWITKLDAQFITLDNPVGISSKEWNNAKARKLDLSTKSTPSITVGSNNEGNKNVDVANGNANNNNTGGTGGDGGGTGIVVKNIPCKKLLTIVPSSTSEPSSLIEQISSLFSSQPQVSPPTSWAQIKQRIPIINGGVPVKAVGAGVLGESGAEYAYIYPSAGVKKRSTPIKYVVLHYTVSNAIDPLYHYQNTWTEPRTGKNGSTFYACSDFTVGRKGQIAGIKSYKSARSNHYGEATWAGGANMNPESIGIEIEALGYCYYCPETGRYYTNAKAEINPQYLTITKPYRTFNLWHKLEDDQIWAIANLIAALYHDGAINDKTTFLQNCHGKARYDSLFPESPLTSVPPSGIYTHGSGRLPADKVDIHPQSNLLEMLDDMPNILTNIGKNNTIKWTT